MVRPAKDIIAAEHKVGQHLDWFEGRLRAAGQESGERIAVPQAWLRDKMPQ